MSFVSFGINRDEARSATETGIGTGTETETETETSMSVFAWAHAAPERTTVIEGEVRFNRAALAQKVAERMKTLVRPPQGRPAFLVPKADLDGLVDLLAHWEARIPAALLSPKLTHAERTALIAHADSIAEPLPDDCAFVVFTSGTTGAPKPAILTRDALTAGALAMVRALCMTPDDVFQLSLSPARVGGLGIVMRALASGCAIALAPGFSGADFPARLARDGVTFASLVPAMLADVLEKHPAWRPPSRLRALLIGGAPFPDRLRAEAARRGIPVVTTYGMTETGSTSALSPFEQRLSPVPVGEVPLEGVSFKAQNGLLALRGPMLFAGYWGRTASVRDGWFETGDAGLLNADGSIRILGRTSDMIITGGEKVVPAEVESALESLPGVREALVLGMPDEKWGQIVTALLVSDASAHPPANAIIQGLATRLARWKSPRRIAWVERLPLTTAGKRNRKPEVLKGLDFDVLHFTRVKQV